MVISLAIAATLLSVIGMASWHGERRSLGPDVILVLYVSHLLLQLAPASFLFYVQRDHASLIYFGICGVSALLIPLGGMVANSVWPATRPSRMRFMTQCSRLGSQSKLVLWRFLLILVGFGAILFCIYVAKVGAAPVYDLIFDGLSWEEGRLMRRAASPGQFGRLYGMAQRAYMPLLFLVGLAVVFGFRSHLVKSMGILGMFLALAFNAWNMDKTSVAMLFLMSVLFLFYWRGDRSAPARFHTAGAATRNGYRSQDRRIHRFAWLAAVITLAYPFLIFLFKPIAEHGAFYIFVQGILGRLFINPAMNSYAAISAFSGEFEFTWFADIKLLATLIGWEYVDLGELVAVYKGQSTFTNAPPASVGTFYAQGGWAVATIGVTFAAFVLKIFENSLYRVRQANPAHLAIYCLLLYGAFRFSWSQFHSILLTETVFPAVTAWAVLGMVSYTVKRRSYL